LTNVARLPEAAMTAKSWAAVVGVKEREPSASGAATGKGDGAASLGSAALGESNGAAARGGSALAASSRRQPRAPTTSPQLTNQAANGKNFFTIIILLVGFGRASNGSPRQELLPRSS